MTSSSISTAAEAVIRLAKAMDTAESSVIATDNSGTILFWNAAAELLFGWRADDAENRNIVDVVCSQQSAADAELIMRQLLTGQTWAGTFMVRHKDGTPILLHVTDVPVLVDGAVVGIVGVSRRA